MTTVIPSLYRKDIDGLRAIAVLAVMAFHFGYLPNGYLGVDIFFVISGFLITGILFDQLLEQQFSIKEFYLRRIRRIIPMVLLVAISVLAIGLLVMLPDDLENLSESVIATNLFSNNILQVLTTKNYWDIINDYKPLLHTWSLGIEEQFYLFYPFLFWAIGLKKMKRLFPILLLLTIGSFVLFLIAKNELFKFYLLPYRFFELSIGGLASLIIKQQFNGMLLRSKGSFLFIIGIVAILLFGNHLPNAFSVCLMVLASVGVVISANEYHPITSMLLENKLLVGIGKISFSLYLWHQPVLVFLRYVFVDSFSNGLALLIFMVILLLSILSYFFIEQPFRNKSIIKTSLLLWMTGAFFILVTSAGLYIYLHAGIVRVVPELNLDPTTAERNVHAKYNDRIYSLNQDFKHNGSTRILVVGNSQARDWANVLLESSLQEHLQISYVEKPTFCKDFAVRCREASLVFLSAVDTMGYRSSYVQYAIDPVKINIIGLKNFGKSNGVLYNKKHDDHYCSQRVKINERTLQTNELLKKQWGNQYIDLIGLMADSNNTVPAFTNDCKFISQDCLHLTKSGAVYLGQLLKHHLEKLLR